jgi:hypothetical protein
MLLEALDSFFLIFHALFTIFNLTGWIWHKTRRIHLFATAITAASWFILGIWYGWGFCFCTEWHWSVRSAIGKPISSNSYIHFFIREIAGLDMDQNIVDAVVLSGFFVCITLAVILNIRDCVLSKRKK